MLATLSTHFLAVRMSMHAGRTPLMINSTTPDLCHGMVVNGSSCERGMVPEQRVRYTALCARRRPTSGLQPSPSSETVNTFGVFG